MNLLADPKPRKRHRASQAEWKEIRAAFRRSDCCCWTCPANWTELHHILNRAHSGDDVIENLAPLCAECHQRIEARDPFTRSLLRQSLMPSNIAYLSSRLAENVGGWLERNYPLTLQSETALG
jgi:5-methylcytosine-specific restriction endonuclease McrA